MTIQLALRTVSLESRRGEEMARLLQRHGLVAIQAPSMREVPLEDQAEALAFGAALMAGQCDWLLLLTGVGARALVSALSTRWPAAAVCEALARTSIACRGPKPGAVLKELGLKASVLAPEPNTWRDLMGALEGHDLCGKRVWVQEYGRVNEALLAALRARGAEVQSAAVYAWQLPEDIEPLRRAIADVCEQRADAIVFTSAQQLEHIMQVAAQDGRDEALHHALHEQILVASIGPVTSDALRERGIAVDLEPQHPKMGHLVKALASEGWKHLERKRGPRQRG